MPNWCMNSMVVYGGRKEVEDFCRKMKEAKKRSEENNHWGLYEAYAVYGHEESWILNGCGGNGYNRGHFDWIGEPYEEKDGLWSLRIDYESAWSPMIDGFDYLLRKHYFTLKQVTLADECGCEIYVNTDESHRWFKERYYVDFEDRDSEYPESEESFLDLINGIVKGKASFGSFAEVKEYLNDNEGLPTENGDVWCSVHEYEPF